MILLKKYPASSLFLVSIALLAAKNAAGAKNYYIKPTLDASVSWNSNYYYAHADETAVQTYLLQPGLVFAYQSMQTRMELDATLDGHSYSGSDTLNDFIGGSLNIDVNRSTKSRQLAFGLKDKLTYTRDPELLGELENVTSRELYKINKFNPYISYEFNRFKTHFDYENIITLYDEDDQEDTALNKGTIQSLHKFNRSFEVGPRIEVESMKYDQDSAEYAGWEASAVLVRNGKFVDLTGKIGYHEREFDTPEGEGSDYNQLSWMLQIKSQPTGFKKTRLSLSLISDMNDTVSYVEGGKNTVLQVMQIQGSIERDVAQNVALGLSATYLWNDYEFTEQEEEVWKTGLALEYTPISWLALQLSAGYQERDSTLDEDDYKSASCMLRLSYLH